MLLRMNGIFREIVCQLPDMSSGAVGEKGFNPIMYMMWGLDGKKSDIGVGIG